MKYILVLLLFASCGHGGYRLQPAVFAAPENAELLRTIGDVIAGSVQVYSVNDKSEGVSRGSGVVVFRGDKSLVLTARHMTEGAEISGWRVKLGKLIVEARCLKRGITPEEDWALLETSYPVGDAVPVLDSSAFSDSVKPYEPAVCVGYGLGWTSPTVTVGHIQEVSDYVRMSAPIIFGNSGGGLFVIHGGRLKLAGITVAIGTGGSYPITHMGLSVPIETIRRRGGLRAD